MDLRLYLDFNSTSPVRDSVKKNLEKGEVFYFNPSSLHHFGRKSLKVINEVKTYLYNFFNLSESLYDLFFHSGVSEAALLGVRGYFENKPLSSCFYAYHLDDHSCSTEQIAFLSKQGIECLELDSSLSLERPGFFYWTLVNNESGEVRPFDKLAQRLKQQGDFYFIDCAQWIGKWQIVDIPNQVDMLSFSGHKFGALPGIGFSFIKKTHLLQTIFVGGGQQPLRSGTLNVLGIHSLKLALEEYQENPHLIQACRLFKDELTQRLKENFPNDLIFWDSFEHSSCNTILFSHLRTRADILQAAFDLEGIALSAGSACRSSSLSPNKYVVSKKREDLSYQTIRLSLNPWVHHGDTDFVFNKLQNVLKRFT